MANSWLTLDWSALINFINNIWGFVKHHKVHNIHSMYIQHMIFYTSYTNYWFAIKGFMFFWIRWKNYVREFNSTNCYLHGILSGLFPCLSWFWSNPEKNSRAQPNCPFPHQLSCRISILYDSQWNFCGLSRFISD